MNSEITRQDLNNYCQTVYGEDATFHTIPRQQAACEIACVQIRLPNGYTLLGVGESTEKAEQKALHSGIKYFIYGPPSQ